MFEKMKCYRFGFTAALALALALLLLQPACEKAHFFEKEIPIANGRWAYGDTLNFQFSIEDTLTTYNLYLDFDYADTFAYQNVYVKLHTQFPDGKRLSKQKSFDLYDVQGQVLGACSGRTCHLRTLLQEKAYFNRPGTYTIGLEQFTREAELSGISAVGLTLEAAGKRE